ncbi:cytochrome c3 family protein [Desulfuromonas versatilis]|nr:cytochrome c3 family protein [Desulfuromonas versatilis]
MKKLVLWGAVQFFASFLFASSVAAADGCLVSDCHADLALPKVVHSPVSEGECESCHQATGAKHPGSAKGFKAVARGGELCLQCHDDVGNEPNRHGPVRAGRCNFCHTPHASDNPALLLGSGNKICFYCHGGIERIVKNARSQHAPVAEGRCWDCHKPHGSEFKPLLKDYYPAEFYTPYRYENFALCFRCHDDRAFLYERTSEATSFRNGDYNLHVLHVNKAKKGRVCKSCHGVHGGDQDKLILSKIPGFGSWEIPINFQRTANGGTCFVGCHKPKTYDRLSQQQILREQKTIFGQE